MQFLKVPIIIFNLIIAHCSFSTQLLLQDDDESTNAKVIVLRLAQCRAMCLSKNMDDLQIEMCWKVCRQLEDEDLLNQNEQKIYSSCTNTSACEMGCREACQVYENHVHKIFDKTIDLAKTTSESFITKKSKNRAIPLEFFDMIENITLSSAMIILPIKLNHSNWVYSFIELNESTGIWKLHGQTNYPKFTIHRENIEYSLNLIRVIVVGPQGIRRIFKDKPGTVPENVQHNSYGHLGAGKENTVMKFHRLKTHYQDEIEGENRILDIWHLRVSSVIYQKFVVLTEVSWDFELRLAYNDFHLSKSNHPAGKIALEKTVQNDINRTRKEDNGKGKVERESKEKFLLTWEIKGSFIRGNLITDISSILLILWPNTTYIIQVNLISTEKENHPSLFELQKQLSQNGGLPVSRRSKQIIFDTTFYIGSKVPIPLPLNDAKSHKNESDETSTSSLFCSWKEPGNSVHFPLPFKLGTRNPINQREFKLTSKELSVCFIVWGVIITCFIFIFLMFTYFLVLFYLAAKKQKLFKKLHSQCSVANIYRRNIYRMQNSFVPSSDSLLASAAESLEMDSCTDAEDNDLVDDQLL